MSSSAAAHIIARLQAGHVAAQAAGLASPALNAFHEAVVKLVAESPDPEATVSAIFQLISREHRKKRACGLYRDCAETGPHYDHSRHDLKVTGHADTPVLEAGMVALSGPDTQPVVYIGSEEFTDASSTRTKTTELRILLDQIDAMAGRVFADHDGRP